MIFINSYRIAAGAQFSERRLGPMSGLPTIRPGQAVTPPRSSVFFGVH
jgi:hypothetical protein